MIDDNRSRPTILLVHGAWHGSWAWSKLRPVLEGQGLRVEVVDLPTVHAPDAARLTLADDSREVARAIDAIEGDVVVVAHSYGGVPSTDGADSPKVRHIVYISAFVLDAGESLLGAVGGERPDWWSTDGTMVTPGNDQRRPQDLFFGDLDAAEADAAAEQLRPQSLRAYTEPVTHVAWRGRPTTFILTENDAIFPPEAQEALAGRAGSVVHRLPTSHSPFISRPDDVAEIIRTVA